MEQSLLALASDGCDPLAADVDLVALDPFDDVAAADRRCVPRGFGRIRGGANDAHLRQVVAAHERVAALDPKLRHTIADRPQFDGEVGSDRAGDDGALLARPVAKRQGCLWRCTWHGGHLVCVGSFFSVSSLRVKIVTE